MKIEIWSDIVCPWCAIGKRRFEKALDAFEHRAAVEVVFRSFELDPSAPAETTETRNEHLAAKYGMSLEEAAQRHAQTTALAAAEGLEFNFERARAGNTFAAHRLLHLAAAHGLQHALKDRLLRAYFTEGEPIGDADTLQRLAVEAGLDADLVAKTLATDAYAEDVRADQARARSLGISGVPFFVVDEKYGVSGAQPPELLLEVLDRAWSERQAV
jgi:predicted DsbA family dithiol-disulfide isomerase